MADLDSSCKYMGCNRHDISLEWYDPYYNYKHLKTLYQALHYSQMYNFVFNHDYKLWNILIIQDICISKFHKVCVKRNLNHSTHVVFSKSILELTINLKTFYAIYHSILVVKTLMCWIINIIWQFWFNTSFWFCNFWHIKTKYNKIIKLLTSFLFYFCLD
jgi:hypothetical protein